MTADNYLDKFRGDVIAEALSSSAPAFWRRRATALLESRPRRGDYTGQATRADLAAAHKRLTAAADACYRHADLLEATGLHLAVAGETAAELRDLRRRQEVAA